MKYHEYRLKWRGFVSLAFALFFPYSNILAVDKAEIVNMFLSLLADAKSTYKPPGFIVSDKAGMRVFTLKEDGRAITYKFDKKNWYMNVNETTDSSSTTADAGMYFKADNTAIVATSISENRFGGPGGLSGDLVFEEFPCDIMKGMKCSAKDITADIFPKIESLYFAKDDQNSKQKFEERGGQKVIIFSIPRIGTTITAALWLDIIKSTAKALKPIDDKMLKYTGCSINWIKKQNKFEIGKCTKNMKTLNYFGN